MTSNKLFWGLISTVWIALGAGIAIELITTKSIGDPYETWSVTKAGECYSWRADNYKATECYADPADAQAHLDRFLEHNNKQRELAARVWVDINE
jgi:hypothetical protein